ncbi:MAG: hypothetical protein IPL28_24575 [Chloroflexi bacterium]|nr:hypothetical protein [Chloroflexota bacterium]
MALAFINTGEWDKALALLPEHVILACIGNGNREDPEVYAALQDVTVARECD